MSATEGKLLTCGELLRKSLSETITNIKANHA